MQLHDWLYLAGGALTLLNVYLTLRLRISVLEMERRVLDQVRKEYYDREMVDAKLEALRPAARRAS
jgi:hypothetical protein